MRTALWSEPGQESLSDLSDLSGLSGLSDLSGLSGLSGLTEVACLTSVEAADDVLTGGGLLPDACRLSVTR